MDSIIKFKHPTTILIAGPTQSGKTCFTKKLIQKDMFNPTPNRILWIYREGSTTNAYEGLQKELPEVEFYNHIPFDVLDNLVPLNNNLLILDDVMDEAAQSESVAQLFTRGSHHRNITVVFILQNLFLQSKHMRTISLNSHYMVLYKNPRDKLQIRNLSIQMFPNQPKYLIDAFEDATKSPYTYLVIDLHPTTEEDYRVRTNIFPSDSIRFYLPAPETYQNGKRK